MYVCMGAYIHTHLWVFMYICMYLCKHKFIYYCMRTYVVWIQISVCRHTCLKMYVCMYLCMYVTHGYLLLQLFVQGSCEQETILLVLNLKLYLALNNKLKNTNLRRKLFTETRYMLHEKNPRINSKTINTNSIPNLLLNWAFANIYYLYYCNKVLLLQLLVNTPVSSSIMVYFNFKWDI